jgi:hypothetical protein
LNMHGVESIVLLLSALLAGALNTFCLLMASYDRDGSHPIQGYTRQEALPCLRKQQHEKRETLLFP